MGKKSLRTLLIFSGLALALFALGEAVHAGGEDAGFKPLFDGKDLKGWEFKLGNNKADAKKTFMVKDGEIVVSGKPNGYIYTAKSYKNYVLKFDWKFATDKANNNSGLLVHITGDQKVWPKCVEVQGQQGDHGRIFAIGGAKGIFEVNKPAQKKAIKPGEWNTTEVICKNGSITSKINGVQVSSGRGELTEGPFGFQSEGSELYLKNIRIKVTD